MNRKCKICGAEKDITKFEKCKGSNGLEYRLNTCRKCRKAREKELHPKIVNKDLERLNKWKDENKGTIEGFIYSNLNRWRKRSSVPSDLTFDYLLELWKKQDGRCYYTNEILNSYGAGPSRQQLTIINRNKNSPSLDKMNPEKGYVIGNVVWCSLPINSMKGELKTDDFFELCGVVFDISKLRENF